jgi:hypothetical protein
VTFLPLVADAHIPFWWSIVTAIGGALAGGIVGQRAGERAWHKERRPVHSNFLSVLDQLRFAKGAALDKAKGEYTDRYWAVYGLAKLEPYLRERLDQLGSDPEAVSGQSAVSGETIRNLQLWLDYDMRWFVFRLLSVGPQPANFELERVGAS